MKEFKEEFNHKNTKMIEIESELDKKNNISDLKNKNLLINKYKKEIEELKEQLNENEKYFNDEEKNRIKKK